MADSDEVSSWLESRRLIISQLSSMEGSIRDLSVKIDRFNDAAREKAIEVAKEAQAAIIVLGKESQQGITELNLRVAMLELRAKLWGAGIGLVAGGIATVAVEVAKRAFEH
jgi:hypothetical protein